MAHAFFDESGKFADSDFVCMAGYVAGDQDWEEFSCKWRRLLLAHEIPYVHMKELSSLAGPYRALGWNESKRDEVLAEFLYVIREHITAGFGIAVDAKYLRTMAPEIRKKIGNPQFLCFQRMLRLMIKKLEIVGYQPAISAIFDDSEEYSIRCYKI